MTEVQTNLEAPLIEGVVESAIYEKPQVSIRFPLEVRKTTLEIELVVNSISDTKLFAHQESLIWSLSDVFLSHFTDDDPKKPDKSDLVESSLFRGCVNNSDLVAVVKHNNKIVAFSSYKFALGGLSTILTKGTFSRLGYDRRLGLGNMLNMFVGVCTARYIWGEDPTRSLNILGRTQHPYQVAFLDRHCDGAYCSTSTLLSSRQSQLFDRLAHHFYPQDNYDANTGIARGLYVGAGAPPPTSMGAFENDEDYRSLSLKDALYFLGVVKNENSLSFRRSIKFTKKLLGDRLEEFDLAIALAADTPAKTRSVN